MTVGVQRTGDWDLARRLLAGGPLRLKAAIQTAVLQEAHALRAEIIDGLTKQAPGGDPIRPLAATTLAARKLTGFRGTKALLRRGDLRGSITVQVEGAQAFVGVSRKARSKGGGALVNVARVQEFGAGPIVIPITPKMRRYLFLLFKTLGARLAHGGGHRGAGVVVVQIPPRPFLRPAFKKFQRGAQGRFLQRVAKLSGLGGSL
jgi:phage gpG-like protein